MCGELKLTLWSHRVRLTLTCSDKTKMSMQMFEDMMIHLLHMVVRPILKREASVVVLASENAVLQTHLFVDDVECKSVSLMQVQERLLSSELEASHAPNGTSVLVRQGISRLVLYRSGVIQVRTRCIKEAEELVCMVATCIETAIAAGDVMITTDESKRYIAGISQRSGGVFLVRTCKVTWIRRALHEERGPQRMGSAERAKLVWYISGRDLRRSLHRVLDRREAKGVAVDQGCVCTDTEEQE